MFGVIVASGFRRVIAESGVCPIESSGDLIDFGYLDSIFEFDSGYHLLERRLTRLLTIAPRVALVSCNNKSTRYAASFQPSKHRVQL